MDADWRSRVKELFLAARERRPEERARYLAKACGEDAELRREVESLLIEHDRMGAEGEPVAEPAAAREPDERAAEPGEGADHDPRVGGTLGRYRILGVVGKGGMGTVYEAEDPELRRKVALKVLPPAVARDPKRLERFKREARAVAALSHPNVVTVFSVEEKDDTQFFTMELVRGEPLDKLIPEQGLDLAEILDRATQLAEGLRAAHEQGIIHRDLKPANVIVDTEGRLRILDFGLAKAQPARPEASQAETSLALTVQGTVLGTAPYMSPEQVEGKPLDARSDIFSLGSILYEMATGRWPFPGETLGKVMGAVLHEEPTPLTELRSDLPEGLERIASRCLAKEPTKRYQSARELRDALEELRQAPPSRRAPAVGRWVALVAVLGVLVLVGVLTLKPRSETATQAERSTAAESARKKIAVLPFENLGRAEDEYFAAGMAEEIGTRLAAIHGLGVISQYSAAQLSGTDKTTKQIGEELGVDYLMAGTVRWARGGSASRVRITPQLIRIADDTQLWADTFDRLLEDVFEIQSDIATLVVEQLDVTLLDSERQRLADRPTDNLEAYQAFLRAAHRSADYFQEEFLRERVRNLELAVELDPGFTRAWGWLTWSHGQMYTFGYDRSQERRRLTTHAAQRTAELEPGSPEAHRAQGAYFYWITRDYPAALSEFEIAEESFPRWGLWTGFTLRRLGRFAEAAARLEQAFELDPLSSNLAKELGVTYLLLRRYDEALRRFERSIALEPDQAAAYVYKAQLFWSQSGDLVAARAALEGAPPSARRGPTFFFWQTIYERDYAGALDQLAELAAEDWIGLPIRNEPKSLKEGLVHKLLGNVEPARAAFQDATLRLEEKLRENPDNEKLQSALGLALAGLGRREDAIRAGRRATELTPLSSDPYFGLVHVEDLAWIYTLLGEQERALAELETLLSVPSFFSGPYLEIDPRWEPLRTHLRYTELQAKYAIPS